MAANAPDIARYRAMSTSQKKAFWRAHPVTGDVPIAIDGLPGFRMHSDNDDTVVKELFWTDFRGWERTSLQIWARIAAESGPGLVLDIGSYTGVYSIIAGLMNPARHVVAVDIQPRCLDRVRSNVELNGIATVSTEHAACIDVPGPVPYFFYEESDVLSSIASVERNALNDRVAEAPGITIDDLVARQGGRERLVLMKIDVEGAERRTLAGARRTLAGHRPDVLIEINDPRTVGSVRRLFPRGYRCYSIDDTSPRVRAIGWRTQPFPDRNFLFTLRRPDEVARLAAWSAPTTTA